MTEDLVARLRDPDPEVRAFAAYYLKNLGGEDAIEPLIVAAGDPEPSVRQAAVHSLAVLGFRTKQGRVLSHVEYALDDESPDVRKEAAMAFGAWLAGMVDGERTIRSLIRRLKDPDPEVAERAAFALENIYERAGRYDLARPLLEAQDDGDADIRKKAREILAKKVRMADERPL
ncbi:MAG TPA: HEAT repeat domain-containing protein [Methanocella sp.]|nr:HEAT repeat domain-containing protein [Methanocella sp.]